MINTMKVTRVYVPDCEVEAWLDFAIERKGSLYSMYRLSKAIAEQTQVTEEEADNLANQLYSDTVITNYALERPASHGSVSKTNPHSYSDSQDSHHRDSPFIAGTQTI